MPARAPTHILDIDDLLGMMTIIYAYHDLRIFNCWVQHSYADASKEDPMRTGVPFNVAYRYMAGPLTVPLLVMEIAPVWSFAAWGGPPCAPVPRCLAPLPTLCFYTC